MFFTFDVSFVIMCDRLGFAGIVLVYVGLRQPTVGRTVEIPSVRHNPDVVEVVLAVPR